MSDAKEKDPYLIDEANEEFIIEWLNDRKEFHKWFTSLIIGSFVLLTIFGNKPGFASIGPVSYKKLCISHPDLAEHE